MKKVNVILTTILLLAVSCGEKNTQTDFRPDNDKEINWSFSDSNLQFSSKSETQKIVVTANGEWTVESDQLWCSTSPNNGFNGETSLSITVLSNPLEEARTANIKFVSRNHEALLSVTQDATTIESYVPEGYKQVWSDEFNDERLENGMPTLPDNNKWWYETAEPGWVNNELQKYVAGVFKNDTVSQIYDGTLKIIAKQHDNNIISARINTIDSWTYGYFEARLKVPGGKGTWPAFWMMPANFTSWPDDGEIDIMEYVGYRPNIVQSSIHTKKYNHVLQTEKTATKTIEEAETEFHIYALEWTADFIKGFVDGEEYFRFDNDKKGDKDTWPFDEPFYLKLNLAWGGDWGGSQGVDNSKLPATYEIDYIRVYQKD